MASKLPLKPINISNIGRPAGVGIPKLSGLPRPSGLKPPGATELKAPAPGALRATMGTKRAASPSPSSEDVQASKKIRADVKPASKPAPHRPAAPGVKAPATRPGIRPSRPPPTTRLNPSASKAGKQKIVPGVTARPTRATSRPVTSKPPAAAKAASAPPSKGAAASKRAAWDYKGRMHDLEAALLQVKSGNKTTAEQLEMLLAERQDLQGEIKVKEQFTSQASEQISSQQMKIRHLEDQLSSSRRTLQQKIDDLEFSKGSVERQRDALDGDLRAAQQEVAGLKTTVATMTAANAGTKAELETTQLNLKQALEAGRLKDSVIAELRTTVAKHEETIEELNAKSREHETERRRLHNVVQELKGNIRVFCRVRPLLGEERFGNDGEIHHMSFPDQDNKILELEKIGDLSANDTLANVPKNGKKYEFCFDRVFGPCEHQSTVFEEISQLVQSALDGYNVCIFAYGQTGSGKTYTMEGPVKKMQEDRGMIPRAVEQVFETGKSLVQKGWQYGYEASFLEIYNETIRDLLGNGSVDTKHDIRMVSKETNEVVVSNLTTIPVTSEDQVHELLQKAAQNRAVAETKCNERSSRSHSVFRLKLSGVNSITEEKSVGMLNLIDLAGSERLKESGSQGARLKETQCINKSLANLGNVIMALGNKDPHIPYRNSKLTHLLQNSLGGNSKTLMFVNVNPREDFIGETLCSLRFATKVNACNIGTAQKRSK